LAAETTPEGKIRGQKSSVGLIYPRLIEFNFTGFKDFSRPGTYLRGTYLRNDLNIAGNLPTIEILAPPEV